MTGGNKAKVFGIVLHAMTAVAISNGQQIGSANIQSPNEPQLRNRTVDTTDNGLVLLDVVARRKSGDTIPDLKASDFVLRDNKKEVQETDFKLSATPSDSQNSQIVFVLDAMNSSLAELGKSEDALEGFLALHGGHLDRPASILVVSDSEPRGAADQTTGPTSNNTAIHQRQLFVHRIPANLDGAVLAQSLKEYKTRPHRILDAQGGIGQAERVRLSLEALSFIANAQTSVPGAKVVLWLGPGWPFLARSDAKSSEQLFDSVIYFSNILRSARMILYSIDPRGVIAKDNSAATEGLLLNSRAGSMRANGHAPGIPIELSNTYYAEFLKGVKEAKQSNPNDLALQVLAYQSGGLVLKDNNDIGAMIRRCAGDATSLYTLSYVPAHGSGTDSYHELQISLTKSSQPLRTRTGLYAK